MNRGFVFDSGDPSVGIFGTEWTHEDCPAWEVDCDLAVAVPEPVIEEQLAVARVDDLTVRTYWLLTCTDCAQQVIVTEDDWSPSEAALRAESQAEADAMAAEAWHDAYLAQYDDDPNPYAGTYSEE